MTCKIKEIAMWLFVGLFASAILIETAQAAEEKVTHVCEYNTAYTNGYEDHVSDLIQVTYSNGDRAILFANVIFDRVIENNKKLVGIVSNDSEKAIFKLSKRTNRLTMTVEYSNGNTNKSYGSCY